MDLDEILAKNAKILKQMKRNRCKRCGEPPIPGSFYCAKCRDEKAEAAARRREGKQTTSGEGYVYEYGSDGKPRLASRIRMEKKLGRPLKEFEIVMYKDGDKKNLEDDNLILGWKAGMPLDFMTCAACGCRGNIIFEGIPE